MSEMVTVERKELVAVPPKAGAKIQPLVPTTMEELKYVAGLIVKCGLAPDSYDNDPQKIAIGIMKGMEVGMPPLSALAGIAIINKRPCIWGDAAIALIQARGLIEKMETEEIGAKPGEESETGEFPHDYGYEVKVWRKGQDEPYVGRFTVGDAKRAKLWMNPKKAPWMQYPRRMLRNRATAFPLRDGFADALMGLHIREEVEDLPPPAPITHDTSYLDDDIPDHPALTPPDSDETTALPADTTSALQEAREDALEDFQQQLKNCANNDETYGSWGLMQKYMDEELRIESDSEWHDKFKSAYEERFAELA